ncbi:hypothetical protein [Flammeovirga kamogawensis]|uniref:Uncharacterized protein n=1 Tax=Flammeovirga kamogawensis TaxID=373891 RepID=A0ABX8GS90_9BACT|nr:hypothetical protein [Flammeovirga kamogawensis]MBB6464030.1 hypothetical protein [Flammeovirga kamogawensis]QWG06137.1 hypothetical protein KM029_12375 [Flammeovirga kamogawensis]TRX67969.1 hypothetical protein EO216_07400 [Flammeovirga kamogawensis]
MRLLSFFAIIYIATLCNVFANVDSNEPTSKSKAEEVSNSNVRYIFLQAVKKDCLEGDTEILSSIIRVDISNFSEQKFSLLTKFQEMVQVKYPKNVIHVNLNSIHGIYTDLRAASTAKKAVIDNVGQSSSIVIR